MKTHKLYMRCGNIVDLTEDQVRGVSDAITSGATYQLYKDHRNACPFLIIRMDQISFISKIPTDNG